MAGRGGSPGRMLGHSPDLSVSQPSFKRQHRKKKNSRKERRREGPPVPVLPSPRSCFGAAAVGAALWWGSKGQRRPFQSRSYVQGGISTDPGLS